MCIPIRAFLLAIWHAIRRLFDPEGFPIQPDVPVELVRRNHVGPEALAHWHANNAQVAAAA